MQQQQSDSFLQSYSQAGTTNIKDQLQVLLENQLKQLEKYLKSDEEANEILNLVQHCHSADQLVELNITLFEHLFNKIDYKLHKYKQKTQIKLTNQKKIINKSEDQMENNYEKLEKQVQKYEAEIRNHISVEQQLKIYAESLQNQVSSNVPSQQQEQNKVDKKAQENEINYQKQNKQLMMVVKNYKQQIVGLKQKINEQQKLIETFQEKEKDQNNLFGNYEKFNTIIKNQQKQKIQNIKNFQNYNIYNVKQDSSTFSTQKGQQAKNQKSNKVVQQGTTKQPQNTQKLEKQRNSSVKSLNVKQNIQSENRSNGFVQDNIKKKYKNMVMSKKLKSQDFALTNNNLKKDIIQNIKRIKQSKIDSEIILEHKESQGNEIKQ